MNHWVLQMGFPVVTIDTSTGRVSQKQFLLDPESNVTVKSPYKYAAQQQFTVNKDVLQMLSVPLPGVTSNRF